MAGRGTRFRVPRKVKKAMRKFWSFNNTPKEMRWIRRCWVMPPHRWSGVRKRNAHVAMGDTTTARLREKRGRRYGW